VCKILKSFPKFWDVTARGQDQGGVGRPTNFSFQRGTSNVLEASGSGTSSSGGAAVGGNAAFPIPQTGGSGFSVQGFQPMIHFQANSMPANNAGFGIYMGPRGGHRDSRCIAEV
jgi:hypothetical protein